MPCTPVYTHFLPSAVYSSNSLPKQNDHYDRNFIFHSADACFQHFSDRIPSEYYFFFFPPLVTRKLQQKEANKQTMP